MFEKSTTNLIPQMASKYQTKNITWCNFCHLVMCRVTLEEWVVSCYPSRRIHNHYGEFKTLFLWKQFGSLVFKAMSLAFTFMLDSMEIHFLKIIDKENSLKIHRKFDELIEICTIFRLEQWKLWKFWLNVHFTHLILGNYPTPPYALATDFGC